VSVVSLRSVPDVLRSTHPVVAELAVVVALLFGVALWRRVVTALTPTVLTAVPNHDLFVAGAVSGGILVAGLAVFAGVYAALRGVAVGLSLPDAADGRLLAPALVVPASLVGLTKLVGVATGVPYNALTKSAYLSPDPGTVLPLLGLGLLVGVPSLVLVCQVLVQGTFERVVDGSHAVVLTTVLTGVVLTGSAGGLTAFPDRGKLALAVAVVVALALALYAADHVDREWIQYAAYLPISALAGLVVVSWVATTGSAAELLFGVALVATLGLAAHGYERTDSLLVPALSYLSLLLASETVVFAFEAGMKSW
jgi:hypothetical protein